MRSKKFLLSFCLITIIAFNQTYDVYADAGSLVVTGGAIGVAGVGVAGITGPVVVAVFVGLMAFGLNVELTRASEEAGMTKTQFVKSKLEQYCQEANIAKDTFGTYILQEAEVFNDGRIKLSDKAAEMIKRFGNWLFENDMVQDTSQSGTDTGSGVDLGDYTLKTLSVGSTYSIGTSSSGSLSITVNSKSVDDISACVCKYSNTADCILLLSKTRRSTIQFKFMINDQVPGSGYNYQSRDMDSLANQALGLYYNYYSNIYIGKLTNYGDIPYYDVSISDILGSITEWTPSTDVPAAGDDSFTGSRDDWASGNPALDPAQDQTLVVNPDLINSIPIPADKDLTWDVNSYLDALEKALDKVANPDVPAVDDATGLPVSIPIPNTITLDPTADRVDNPDLPSQKTPVIDPNKQPEGEQAVDPLKFDLKNIFPFCLPWDIKDMLNLLKANPQAPSYHVDWHIPIVNTDLEFTVDLSPFNSVAAIARKMELLAFIVGLAVITRRMIRG